MDSSLSALFAKANVSQRCIDKFAELGFVAIADVSGIGDTEGAVNVEVLDSDDFKLDPKTTSLERSRIRTAWAMCRKATSVEASAPVGASSEESFLAGTEERLYKVWLDKYSHNLQGTRLMSQKLLVRMYKGLSKSQKQIEPLALEYIRLKSDLVVTPLQGSLITGNTIVQVGVELQECDSRAVAYCRIRAWSSSLCFLACEVDLWFTLEDNEAFVDQIFALIFLRGDGRHPSIKSIQNAWMATVSEFATQVQLHGLTMSGLTKNKSGWVHYWKDIDTFEGGPRGRASSAAAVMPADVANNESTKDVMLRSLQSQLDKAKANLKLKHNTNRTGGGGGADDAGAPAPAATGSKPGKGFGKRARGNRTGGGKRKVTATDRA